MSITFSPTHRDDDGAIWHDESDLDVNVSNSNGHALLTALGIEPECYGSIDAADLQARCLLALALDEGEALVLDPTAYEGTGANGCRWIDVPRRDGYMNERFGQLLRLAEANLGSTLGWA